MIGSAGTLVLATPVLIYGVLRKDQPGDDIWARPAARSRSGFICW